MGIGDEIKEVEVLLEQTNVAFQEQEDTAKKINSKAAEIRDAIRSGKASTGDKIQDFIIVAYGFLPKDKYAGLYTGLCDLSEELLRHSGEMVLVIERRYDIFGRPSRILPKINCIKTDLRLGVISDQGLILDVKDYESQISVKDNHFLWNKNTGEWLVFTNSIIRISHLITALGKPIYPPDAADENRKKQEEETWEKNRGKFGSPPDLALEIFIGDDKVEGYFKSAATIRFSKNFVMACPEALRILGVSRPLPKEIEEVMEKERDLILRGLLDQGSDKIAWLRNALKMEMHMLVGRERSYEKEPGIKMVVDVATFIRAQFKKYNIKIEEE